MTFHRISHIIHQGEDRFWQLARHVQYHTFTLTAIGYYGYSQAQYLKEKEGEHESEK